MKFKDLSEKQLTSKIQALQENEGVNCHWLFGTIFYMINPKVKAPRLKQTYKPDGVGRGLHTEYQEQMQANTTLVKQARDRIQQNFHVGQHYDNPEASLKLHLSLNKIAEIDEEIILGLINLLVQEAEAPNNGLSFHFKIINPASSKHDRFKDNDQLTIYFDKYSSTSDVIRLSQRINAYLLDHLPENTKRLGEKDSFGFNSFVSARFDTNKLLSQYSIYAFFDLELKKFFEKHSNPEDLDQLPLSAFEAVFNKVISDKNITLPRDMFNRMQGLSRRDSIKVQNEFDLMLANPILYIGGALQARQESSSSSANPFPAVDPFAAHYRKLENFKIYPENNKFNETQDALHKIIRDAQPDLLRLDKNSRNDYAIIAHERLSDLNAAYGQNPPDEAAIIGLMNPRFSDFIKLLEKLESKKNHLQLKSPVEKGPVAQELYNQINTAFISYNRGTLSYADFKTACDDAIATAKPTLEIHRGWKALFFNLLAAVGTLGGLSIYRACKYKNVFFKVNTASENLIEEIEQEINNRDENNLR